MVQCYRVQCDGSGAGGGAQAQGRGCLGLDPAHPSLANLVITFTFDFYSSRVLLPQDAKFMHYSPLLQHHSPLPAPCPHSGDSQA